MSVALEGHCGIITGAGSGIGRGLAEAFIAAGAQVAILEADAAAAEQAAEELGASAVAYGGVDVTDPEAVEAAVGAAHERFGQLDFLVNNAGIRHEAPFLEHELEPWKRTLDVNLTGVYIVGQAVARRMVDRPGRILNIASIAGLLALRNRAAYIASKAGVIGLTKAMAFELGEQGICVNAIGPGVIETPLIAHYFQDPDRTKLIVDSIPLGRWGHPEDLAGPAIFLCSPAAAYVTGQFLCVDGGWVSGKGY
ncbi:glucose 1-dehydrogenase [Baekduia soli]|uniref:Glucose 1-dehydrogenase n=1 Tax=Baekduia soli TaxID=496014 RepID=A0A5B8U2J6_9ACTN|nr:glucose 1-dehydrogenase [Baekduia soli]QEC47236.1 glucose 1-dehydrogenase [Baekduia soli]